MNFKFWVWKTNFHFKMLFLSHGYNIVNTMFFESSLKEMFALHGWIPSFGFKNHHFKMFLESQDHGLICLISLIYRSIQYPTANSPNTAVSLTSSHASASILFFPIWKHFSHPAFTDTPLLGENRSRLCYWWIFLWTRPYTWLLKNAKKAKCDRPTNKWTDGLTNRPTRWCD